MASDEAFDDVSSLLGGFYNSSRSATKEIGLGQVAFVPVLELERRHRIAYATRAEPNNHEQATLHIRPHDEKIDFRGKGKRLPIKALNLDENSELVVSCAKMRPCLVLGRAQGVDSKSLPEGVQRNKALNAFVDHYLLAPMFGISSHSEPGAFGPVITARIRCLMYPNFVYMPQSGGIVKIPSVLRLDRLFVNHLAAGCDPQNLFVIPKVLAICHEQIKILLGQEPSAEYKEAREILLDCLPAEFKENPKSGSLAM